jgi:hypothetical protein
MSFHWEFLGSRHIFKTADNNIPFDSLDDFDDEAREIVREFISSKKATNNCTLTRQASSSGIYYPLEDGEIRVIELHAADFNAPFRANLHTVSIDFTYPISPDPGPDRLTNHGVSLATESSVWYTALSYTWGSNVFDTEVHIGSNVVKITSSLACALRYLRSPDHSVFLWIDQIVRLNRPSSL